MLFDYMKQCQRFLRDSRQMQLDPEDLISYCNRARRQVAMQAECLRQLTPISGSVLSASITARGIDYTAPSITVTPPDFPSGNAPYPVGLQATATIAESGGTISSISMTDTGAGYYQPQFIINDPTGIGAAATPNLSFINQLVLGQEAYPFSQVSLSSTIFPGVASIYSIRSVSLIFSNYRFSLPCYSFSVYQARIRNYPLQYQYVPAVCAQYGQGTNGSFYMYPIPSQSYQLEWDCFCLPSDLNTDTDYEALPGPWTDAVPYFMAHLCYLELQNGNKAREYLDLFDRQMNRYSIAARPGRATNPNGGRW